MIINFNEIMANNILASNFVFFGHVLFLFSFFYLKLFIYFIKYQPLFRIHLAFHSSVLLASSGWISRLLSYKVSANIYKTYNRRSKDSFLTQTYLNFVVSVRKTFSVWDLLECVDQVCVCVMGLNEHELWLLSSKDLVLISLGY